MMARTPAPGWCGLLRGGFGASQAWGEDYYVSPAGGDRNLGPQPVPWRNISRVNETDLEPGDRILFLGGERFLGTIELDRDDSGTPGEEIVVTSYGTGRAIIDGGDGSALKANGGAHLVIRDIDFIGLG